MLAVLRQRNFALLWSGGLVSDLGSGMLYVALPFYVFLHTGSTLATGGMVVAEIVPSLLLGSVTGVLVDRWDRRRTMIVCDLLRALLTLLLLVAPPADNLWLLYVVAAGESVISLFFEQAEAALLPSVVDGDKLVEANALSSLSGNIIRLAAPALGAAVLATAGLPALVVLDSVSYTISALALVLLQRPATTPHADGDAPLTAAATGFWRDWFAGLRLIRTDALILPLLVAQAIAMIGQGMFNVLLVPYVQERLHAGPIEFGWLVSAQGVGGIVGGLVVGHVARIVPARHLIVLGLVSAGAVLLAAAGIPVLYVVLALLAIVGAPVVGWLVGLQTLLQHGTTDAYRGRVMGAFGTCNTAFLLLGVLIAGALGGSLDIQVLVMLAGALFVVAGVVAFVRLPRGVLAAPSQLEPAVG
jgi:MFS family permease